MRFYDADSGHIQVSGHDVMHMTRHSLRKNYGMVLQETWLKKGNHPGEYLYGENRMQPRKK